MTASALMAGLANRGVNLIARDGRLVIDAPAGVMTDTDFDDLRRFKALILSMLPAEPPPPWYARPPELSTWNPAWRGGWGHRSNDLEDTGLDWRSAERQAFTEVLAARREAGLPDYGAATEPEVLDVEEQPVTLPMTGPRVVRHKVKRDRAPLFDAEPAA